MSDIVVNPYRTFWGNHWNVLGTLVGSIAVLCVVIGTFIAARSANRKKRLEQRSDLNEEEPITETHDEGDGGKDSKTNKKFTSPDSKIGKWVVGTGLGLGLVTMCIFYQPMIEIYPGEPGYDEAIEATKPMKK